jgi:hypothetical protein
MPLSDIKLVLKELPGQSGVLSNTENSFYSNSNSWRIAEPFRCKTPTLEMEPIHPHPTAAVGAMHRWADTKTPYEVRLSWKGGEPPFKITTLNAPASTILGVNGREQTFDRTQDVDLPTMWVHTLPKKWATVTWQPTEAEQGDVVDFAFQVTDQNLKTIAFRWKVTVDNSRFRYFDTEEGLDTNVGSFEQPFKTLHHGFYLPNASALLFRFKRGTYYGIADYQMSDTVGSLGYQGVGDGVYFDMSEGLFSNGTNDISFRNINFIGNRSYAANPKTLSFTQRTNRLHISNCLFEPTHYGSIANDNPAAIMFWNISPSIHQYISVVDCVLSPKAKCQFITIFAGQYVIIENCHTEGYDMPDSNGQNFIHLKDSGRDVSVRFCSGAGAGGFVVTFSNQQPEISFNQEVLFCYAEQRGPGYIPPIAFNVQPASAPFKGVNQTAQRCTIKPVGTAAAMRLASNGVETTGEPVKVSGIIWSGVTSNLSQTAAGGVNVGETSIKVINASKTMQPEDKVENLGRRGWTIASTLVE